MAVNLSRLKAQLLVSGIQQTNNPLWQVINQLIDAAQTISNSSSGSSSSVGVIGKDGLSGPPGISGEDGDDGSIGPQGMHGIDGVAGITGPTGPTTIGPMGIDGEDGNDGFSIPGNMGLTGPTGLTGPAGPLTIGPMGIEGEQGEDGFGFPGLAGKDGITGTFSRGITLQGIITTGLKGVINIPVNCTIIRWILMADVAGSIQFDVVVSNPLITYPPVASIVAAAPPALVADDFNENTSLVGWTIAMTTNNVMGFSVTSVSGALTRVTLQIVFQT